MNFEKLNALGRKKKPFIFICSYDAKELIVIPLDELELHDVEYCIDENYTNTIHEINLEKFPIDYIEYKIKFDKVIKKIESGETYLLNLTVQTPIKTDMNLKEIYSLTNAHYKLRCKNKFVCFSPEKFIQISNNKINTFPMKGTIDASIDNANSKILNDKKEMAEHIMIVDLLRNDLSMVSSNVKVDEFRYITKIDAGKKALLQVSSHISGDLDKNWNEHIGDILQKLLPAGSISGTPKKSTLDIIKKVENYERNFYSGVFGIFDGKTLDSGVMIRFIENQNNNFIYKSGGGITLDSIAKQEYEEMLEKIYIP